MTVQDMFQKMKLRMSGAPATEAEAKDEALSTHRLVHYAGPLGEFDYDPSEFSLRTVSVPAGGDFTGGSFECLKYVGEETDGAKIKIPEGLQDMSFMFMGDHQLKAAPKIPDSIQRMQGAFMDCVSMEKGPAKVAAYDASFAFYNCRSMKEGPKVVDVANSGQYMFGECSSMTNTPKLREGLVNGEYMFAGCAKMAKEPSTPHSLRYRKNMLANCDTILDSKAQSRSKEHDKAAQKYLNKISKPTLREKAMSAFTYMVQAKAMYSDTHLLIYSLFKTHSLRARHVYSTHMDGTTLGMMAGRQSNVVSRLMGQKAKAKMQAERADRMEWAKTHPNEPYRDFYDRQRQKQVEARMEEWMSLHHAYASNVKSEGERVKRLVDTYDKSMLTAAGRRDMSENARVQASIQSPIEVKTAYYDRMFMADQGGTNEDRAACAKFFADQMAAYANYSHYMESEAARMKTSDEKYDMQKGLSMVSDMQASFLMEQIKYLQTRHGVFTESQMQRIDDAFGKTVYGREHMDQCLAQSGFMLSSSDRIHDHDRQAATDMMKGYVKDRLSSERSSRGDMAGDRFDLDRSDIVMDDAPSYT